MPPVPPLLPKDLDLIALACRNATIIRWVRSLDVASDFIVRDEMATDFRCPALELSSGMTTPCELDWLWEAYGGEIRAFERQSRDLS